MSCSQAYLLVLNSCCGSLGCCITGGSRWVTLLLYVLLLLQRGCTANSSCQKVLLQGRSQRLQGLQCSKGDGAAQQDRGDARWKHTQTCQ